MTKTPSGRLSETSLLLPGVPEQAVIYKAGLVVVNDHPIRGWRGDRGGLSSPLDPALLGLKPDQKIMWFRIKPEDTSPVTIGDVQWWRTIWPGVPVDQGRIKCLLLKAAVFAHYGVPGKRVAVVPTKRNGSWFPLELEDVQEVGKISALGDRKEPKLWEVRVSLLSSGDRSTTVELLAAKANPQGTPVTKD